MRYTLEELRSAPRLAQGQSADLKKDDGACRVWLSRCGVEDGMPYNNAVTVEFLEDGAWRMVHTHEAIPGRAYYA